MRAAASARKRGRTIPAAARPEIRARRLTATALLRGRGGAAADRATRERHFGPPDSDVILTPILVGAPRDQTRAELVADVGPRPLDEDEQSVAEPDELEDVDEGPEEPRRKAGESQPGQVRHGRGPAD